jgi:putative ABC transport system permease protein
MQLLATISHALRAMRRRPALAATAIAVFALGVAVPSTMFSIVEGCLRDIPVLRPDELVDVQRIGRQWSAGAAAPFTTGDYIALRDRQRSLKHIAAYRAVDVDVGHSDEPAARVASVLITVGGLDLLGVSPARGRLFDTTDARVGASPVAIISHALWQSKFGASPEILNQNVTVNGVPHAIVGVMPARFNFPERHDMWRPIELTAAAAATDTLPVYSVIGRRRADRTIEQAQTEVAGIARQLELDRPEQNADIRFAARPYRDAILPRDVRTLLHACLVAVSFVLLIACANAANLLLVRSFAMRTETAVRAALGASRGRLIFERLVESSLLAVIGGVIGVALSRVGVQLFVSGLGDSLSYWMSFEPDARFIIFVSAAVLLSAVIAGFVPALQASATKMREVLQDQSRGASSFRLVRLSRGLVVAQVALSCALLVVAGLMARGVLRSLDHAALDPTTILTASFELRTATYPDGAARNRFMQTLVTTLGERVGVTVAGTRQVPSLPMARRRIELADRPAKSGAELPWTPVAHVTPGYFATLGRGLLRGRDFSWGDDETAPRVAIVSEPLVRQLFGNDDPVGRRIHTRGYPREQAAIVVGVVPSSATTAWRDGTPEPTIFFPLSQEPSRISAVVLRTSGGDIAPLVSTVRQTIRQLDPHMALFQFDRLSRVVSSYYADRNVFVTMIVSFGGAALVLAIVGLYAIMTFTVAQRTREIGVRFSLGARTAQVAWMLIRSALAQLGVGVGAGVVLAWLISPYMRAALSGISLRDFAVYGVVVGVMMIAGFLGTIVPLRTALVIQPVEALRS